MSGGGRTVVKGRMGQSVVRAEPCVADIEKLQTDLDKVFEEYNQLKARQNELEPQIGTLSRALADMKMDRMKYSIEVQVSNVFRFFYIFSMYVLFYCFNEN